MPLTVNPANIRIGIIGLGYVGLPLAVEFTRKYPVVGFDVKQSCIEELRRGEDSTREVDPADLQQISSPPARSVGGAARSAGELRLPCQGGVARSAGELRLPSCQGGVARSAWVVADFALPPFPGKIWKRGARGHNYGLPQHHQSNLESGAANRAFAACASQFMMSWTILPPA